MKVYEHGAGRVITLDRSEQFLLRDAGSEGQIRVSTVTTFTAGDELGPYFTAWGKPMAGGFAHELDFRFRDAGLLPPHVRRAVAGVPELDFPTNLADTGLRLARGMQVGEVPLDRDRLPTSTQAVSRFVDPSRPNAVVVRSRLGQK